MMEFCGRKIRQKYVDWALSYKYYTFFQYCEHMQHNSGATKSKGMLKVTWTSKKQGRSSGDAIGLPLKTQTHAVKAAVTDHIAVTEVIFFNSLPWRAIEHSGRRGWKPCQLILLPKAQVFPLSAICRAPRPLHCCIRGSGWQQLPCAITSFISRLS